jgi:hypothetical protein
MTEGDGRPNSPGKLEWLLDREHFWSVIAGLVIVFLISSQHSIRTYDYSAGDVVEADIAAPIELRVPDPESTARRRDEARAAVLDVYDFDPFAWREPVASLNALFAWGREQVLDGGSWPDLERDLRVQVISEADAVLGLMLPDGLIGPAWDEGFTAETELAAERLLRNQVQHALLGTTQVLSLGRHSAIRLRDIADQKERVLDDLSDIVDLETARGRIRRQVMETLEVDAEMEEGLAALLGKLLLPNLTYSSNETLSRRQDAVGAVDQVFYQVKRGRAIAREGDAVTDRMLRELTAFRQQGAPGGSRTATGGILLLVGLAIAAMWRYVRYYRRRNRVVRVARLHHLLLILLVGTTLVTRISLFIGDAVARSFAQPPYNVAEAYSYALPVAVGALLVVLLVDADVAWIYAAVQAVILGVMTGSLELAVYALLSSFAAVFALVRYSQRTAMARTVVVVGLVNVLVVLGFALLAQPAPPWSLAGFEGALALFGGIQVAVLAMAVLPPLESMFNTLTDIKLLELSNMNLPLLKQLAVVAPGTYHHSIVVGTLAEKAAEAIGANPLFARVAAYYHDVGKMRQPEYFVENQKDGRNPHDGMVPQMSARILVRHVKEGIAYAHENRLPQALIDIVPQHPGTRFMRYFHERAKQQAGDEGMAVREEDFRYPGPRPQSREAALIMLADGVEAMSHLIQEPTEIKLRQMIGKNVREVLDDGQLDECDMTLADLSKVTEAFVEVLSGMHHYRIEYPEESATAEPPDAEAAESPAQQPGMTSAPN